MKRIWAISLLGLSLICLSFAPGYSLEEVASAIRNGNASQLARYFDNRVDVTLPGKSDNYSRNQAELILRDFFIQNEVRTFQIKHKGDNNDGSQYCIGSLQTNNGDYRAKLFMKTRGDKQVIQELEFSSQE